MILLAYSKATLSKIKNIVKIHFDKKGLKTIPSMEIKASWISLTISWELLTMYELRTKESGMKVASIKGFELRDTESFRGHPVELLRRANLYCRGKKVGFITEQVNGGMPIIKMNKDCKEAWAKAVCFFKETFYDSKDIATDVELFYFLLALNEWEQILLTHLQDGRELIVVMEEIDKIHGYRTGAYKVCAPKSYEELQESIVQAERYSAEEKVWWRKMSFRSVEELNFG